jgi:hypothetical protein
VSATYLTEVVSQKKFIGNVVIKIAGGEILDEFGDPILDEFGFPIETEEVFIAIRQPDAGLVLQNKFKNALMSLVLNPTSVDLRRVSTTVASYSFKVSDKDGIITSLIQGNASNILGREVDIYLGRTLSHEGRSMDFADYYKLPTTVIKKIDFADNAYSFTSNEQTDRMDKTIYDFKSALAVNVLPATSTFTMRDDITDFPATGFLKVGSEFVSYTGKDLPNNRFTGVVRGELSSIPAIHQENDDCVLVETVTDNPLNIILKILTSGGGGSAYDVLQDGLAIDEGLIDIAGIESLRDNLFDGVTYTLSLYNIDSALKTLEDELLMPNNLRFTYSLDSKITLIVLDRAKFVEDVNVIDHDSIIKFPRWSTDGNKVFNSISVQWDFEEGSNQFKKRSTYSDAESIAKYGRIDPLTFSFKGVKSSLDGQTLVDDFANRLLVRLGTPTPEINLSTHVDKSLQTIGDKSRVESSLIPSKDGSLNFASELEIISRSINFQTGDVSFKLAFTSFTNIRSCYIAPSNTMTGITSQSVVSLALSMGDFWQVGWKVRLWDNLLSDYADAQINEIASISGDVITFVDPWATTLTPNDFKLKFADYDNVVSSQKRYCFVSDSGDNFIDDQPTYKVTY